MKDGQPFEVQLKKVAQDIRGAVLELLASVEADPASPRGLAKRFSLDKSLTWKIGRLVQETDPASAISHLPGPSGMRILLRGFERAGARKSNIAAVETAVAKFNRLVKIHSGDRATMDIMLGHLARDQQQRMETHRKQLYRGSSGLLGVQTRVRLTADFIAPGSGAGDLIDIAFVSAFVDFRRLRRAIAWPMGTATKCGDDGLPANMPRVEPLDPAFGANGSAPLIGSFCSHPLPPLRVEDMGQAGARYVLDEGPIGDTAALTCATGWFCRGFASRYQTQDDKRGAHITRLETPAELLIQDLFVHEALPFKMPPEVDLYTQLGNASFSAVFDGRGTDLPFSEEVAELGTGPVAAATTDVPRYVDVVRGVFERVGWDPSAFTLYRFRMRYPPIASLSALHYELPPRP